MYLYYIPEKRRKNHQQVNGFEFRIVLLLFASLKLIVLFGGEKEKNRILSLLGLFISK